MDSYLQWKGASRHCIILSIRQRSLTCPVISSSVTEHGGGLHASSSDRLYAAVLQVPPRSPGPWHLQTPTLCHTAALSWFRGTARGLWRLPLGSYQISYQGNLSFFLRRRNTNLSSPWILYIDIKTYKEKFCTQDLFINLLYGTLILWRSYEGWDLSSSIKGLFYYQHVDCGYYPVRPVSNQQK